MIREKRGGESVTGSKEAILRRNSCEGFQRFIRCGVIARIICEGVHSQRGDGCDGVGTGRWRILKGLAAHIEAAHGWRLTGAIKEAAVLCIAKLRDGCVHG